MTRAGSVFKLFHLLKKLGVLKRWNYSIGNFEDYALRHKKL